MYKEHLGRCLWQNKAVWKEKIINSRWGKMRESVWQKQKGNPISFLSYLVQTEEHETEKLC